MEPTARPAMLDGISCRGALRNAQEKDPQLAVISKQLRAACSASSRDGKLGWLEPRELEEFRLNPLDDVLKTKSVTCRCSILGARHAGR